MWNNWVLPNGLTCFYKQSAGVPLAAATLLLRSGSACEAISQAGLASLTADLMLQGTRRRSSLRIAEAVEAVGASLGASATEDYTEMGFSAPVGSLARILDVAADVLTEPSFPSAEIRKESADVLASLESRKDSQFTVAFDAFNAAMFGPRHPYGRRPPPGRARQSRRTAATDATCSPTSTTSP